MIGLLQHEERVQVIDCALHDLAHFSLSDMGILPFPVACGTGLPGMDVFDWSIAKSHNYQSLGLSGQSGQILGGGHRLFHSAHYRAGACNHSSPADASTVSLTPSRRSASDFCRNAVKAVPQWGPLHRPVERSCRNHGFPSGVFTPCADDEACLPWRSVHSALSVIEVARYRWSVCPVASRLG